MAFTQGIPISASQLNTTNGVYGKTSGTLTNAYDYIHDWMPNNGRFYSHRMAGTPILHIKLKCGWFGGGTLKVQKLDSAFNVVSTIYDKQFGWNTNTEFDVNGTGPSWYRIYSADAWQFDPVPWTIYWGQNDCTAGQLLTYYQNQNSGGGRLPGTPLTVAVLNSGLAGTF
jgi:hypothetical protein